jgi:uncharacterized membrane protein
MSKFLRTAALWLFGGFIYYLIEVAWRGYSHPTMYRVGGLCFVLLGGINNWLPWELGLVWQCLIGSAVVTAAEFVSGLIINRGLGLNVWDYSDMPANLLGQVCLLYTILWIPLSLVGILLDDYLRWKLYGEEKPRYTVWGMRGARE